jgi:hypothetical protein
VEGSIDMRVSRATWGELVLAYSVKSALYPQRQSLYPFGDAKNLRGRGLREEVLNRYRGRRTGQVRLRVRQPASFRAGSEITLSEETLS